MSTSIVVLVPPLLVFSIALITRNVVASLLIGIGAAALIATNYSPLASLSLIATRGLEQTDLLSVIKGHGSFDKLFMFGFLILLGILVELLTHTGGLQVYTKALLKKIKNSFQAQITALFLPFLFFLDDYLSTLTVTSIMKPLTDTFRVPRAKLAYLLNSSTSPLSVILPASSWVGMILTQLEASGITRTVEQHTLMTQEPFVLYLRIIPFLFYPFLSIISAWYIVIGRISYGRMKRYEQIAQETGNVFGGKPPLNARSAAPAINTNSSPRDVLIPVVVFMLVCIALTLYSGGFSFSGTSRSLLQAIINGNTLFALFGASLCAVVVSTARILYKKQMTFVQVGALSKQGYFLMQNALAVLLLSWTLSALLQNDLHTGAYIADILLKSVGISFIPLIVFLSAALTSASTGSAWGTIMFIAPLALPLIVNSIGQPPLGAEYSFIVAPIVGALLSGSIAGGHFSPITDSTVLTSSSTESYHIDHVQTQATYSIPAFLGSTLGFIVTGMFYQTSPFISVFVALLAGLTLCITLIWAQNKLSNRKTA